MTALATLGLPDLVALPDYHQNPMKPRSILDAADMWDSASRGPLGLWEFIRFDLRTGRDLSREWSKNVLTDNGALVMLGNTFGPPGTANTLFSYIAICFGNIGYAQVGSPGISSGANVTSIPTPGGVQVGIPASAQIVVSYGQGTAETFTVTSAGASIGATSIPVLAQQAQQNHVSGDYIIVLPSTGDNPSSLTNAIYSIPAGTTWASSGSGSQNRQMVVTYTFAAGSTPGSYTEGWLTSVNPVTAVGQTAAHDTGSPKTIDVNTGVTINIIVKI